MVGVIIEYGLRGRERCIFYESSVKRCFRRHLFLTRRSSENEIPHIIIIDHQNKLFLLATSRSTSNMHTLLLDTGTQTRKLSLYIFPYG